MMATEQKGSFEIPEPKLIAGIVVGALFFGAYAAWMAADFLPRALVFVFVALGVGGMLYQRDDGREQLVYAGYVLAGLLVLTPILMVLPDVVAAGVYGRGAFEMLFMTANFVLFLIFAVPAAVVAYLSYRFS